LTPGKRDAVNGAAIVLPSADKRLEQGGFARPGNADGKADPAAGAQLVDDRALRLAVLGREVQLGKCPHSASIFAGMKAALRS